MAKTKTINFHAFPSDHEFFVKMRSELGLKAPGAFKLLIETYKSVNPELETNNTPLTSTQEV